MKRKYLEISIVLSIISIAVTVILNIQIAKEYLKSDGKTRALFGIKELFQFGYQYYVVVAGIASLILATLSKKVNTQRHKKTIAILLSLLAIAIVFVRIWKFLI